MKNLKIILLAVAGIALLAFLVNAVAETTVTLNNPEKWNCLAEDGTVLDSGKYLGATTDACEERSRQNPAKEFTLIGGPYTVVTVPDLNEDWVIASVAGTDRPLYECDVACVQSQTRGKKLATRTYPERLGRCEGPLDPVWLGRGSNQWQFHTGPGGERGLTYCSYGVPDGPDPHVPVEPPPPIPCPYDTTLLLEDPLCVEPQVEPCAWDPTLNADDLACIEPEPEPGISFSSGRLTSEQVYYEPQNVFGALPATWTIQLDPIGPSTVTRGLVSRDETNQDQAGHLSAYITSDGRLNVRWQAALVNQVLVVPTKRLDDNQPHTISLNLTSSTIDVYIDGIRVDGRTGLQRTMNNGLPLVVGNSCVSCIRGTTAPMNHPLNSGITFSISTDGTIPDPPPEPVIVSSTLMWNPPTLNEDGTPINGTLEYVGYWGNSPDSLTNQTQRTSESSIVIPGLTVGQTYSFAVKAISTTQGENGPVEAESEFSNVITRTITLPQ